MAVVLGVDIGTTTITGLAMDTAGGEVLAVRTISNDAEITSASHKAKGYSEWDARRMVRLACQCLGTMAERLGPRRGELAGIGITGQQHGVVIVDGALDPLTPLINWQDRRGTETYPGANRTYVEEAIARVGQDASERVGCRLAAGFMGVTLFWMKQNRVLPESGRACFIMDFFGSVLTGQPPVSDPTSAASSGLLDVRARKWDMRSIEALGLPASLWPSIREASQELGTLTSSATEMTGLTQGLPVFVALGDNQASFIGSVASRGDTVLLNVGTGAQVAAYTDAFTYAWPLETRPFPTKGYLLVSAGLCGGRSYAILERFFRSVGSQLLGVETGRTLYEQMNRLAASAPRGADGLQCEPLFAGSRAEPQRRAVWTGASPENFTPAHMARALLEGMARQFHTDCQRICRVRSRSFRHLIGSGNGLRENPVLTGSVADAFAISVQFPQHREEAALGAALVGAIGAGCFRSLDEAGMHIQYERLQGILPC